MVEPAVFAHGGRIVKRLGDGLMAAFDDPASAIDAAHDAVRVADAAAADQVLVSETVRERVEGGGVKVYSAEPPH